MTDKDKEKNELQPKIGQNRLKLSLTNASNLEEKVNKAIYSGGHNIQGSDLQKIGLNVTIKSKEFLKPQELTLDEKTKEFSHELSVNGEKFENKAKIIKQESSQKTFGVDYIANEKSKSPAVNSSAVVRASKRLDELIGKEIINARIQTEKTLEESSINNTKVEKELITVKDKKNSIENFIPAKKKDSTFNLVTPLDESRRSELKGRPESSSLPPPSISTRSNAVTDQRYDKNSVNHVQFSQERERNINSMQNDPQSFNNSQDFWRPKEESGQYKRRYSNFSRHSSGESRGFQFSRRPSRSNRRFSKPIKAKVARNILIKRTIDSKELGALMSVKSLDVQRVAEDFMGTRIYLNTPLSTNVIEVIIETFGHIPKILIEENFTIESIINERLSTQTGLLPRPPIVTIMGHVDHGKTSLLDVLRSSNLTAREAGGITQAIGTYQLATIGGKKITFIDTPGHEAFSKMRENGASATDIVVLVVACDDGIMPQTVEAIHHAKMSGVPIIVAINKIDKASKKHEEIEQEIGVALIQHDVLPEAFGGDVMMVCISTIAKINLEALLDNIILQAEMLELEANYKMPAIGVVIESKITKNEGITANLLVQNGTLQTAQFLLIGENISKIRSIRTETSKSAKFVEPSSSAEISGFTTLPKTGEKFVAFGSEKEANDALSRIKASTESKTALEAVKAFDRPSFFTEEKKKFKFIIKTDNSGSLEAVIPLFQRLQRPETEIEIIMGAAGKVSISDIALAKTTDATIINFAQNVDGPTASLAMREKVSIKSFEVIYKILENIEQMISATFEPAKVEKVQGKLLVKEIFTIGRSSKGSGGVVAGCKVEEGLIKISAMIRIYRKNKIIADGLKIDILKVLKDTVKEVKVGVECGLMLEDFVAIEKGDIIEAYIVS